jgi:hypothetical protein
MCSSRDLFRQTVPQKCGRDQMAFGLRLESEELHHSAIRTKKELDFGGFFHQVTVRQPIGRQDSMQTVNRTSRRLDSFLQKIKNIQRLMSF